ncbi:MAG: UvrD-helicase domain-containing protein [Gemmatimonadota bacterium]
MTIANTEWTDEQADAILAVGDVLLAASAGTGKTTTIVGKILWLLGLPVGVRKSTGEPIPACAAPCKLEEIAAVTFTEKGAYDLKQKLRTHIQTSERGSELRWDIDRASVGTIHGFCGELLRDHALRLGIDPTFRILDERETRLRQDEIVRDVIMASLEHGESDTGDLVRRFGLTGWSGRRNGSADYVRSVLKDLRWRPRRFEGWTIPASDALGRPSLDTDRLRAIARDAGAWTDRDGAAGDEQSLRDSAALYRLAHQSLAAWLKWLEHENLRDFDSLILDARRLLTRATPEMRTALHSVRQRYRILIVDEFQDTDGAQKDIAFALAGLDDEGAPEAKPQLFLVGDPKQSIYRFRGADISVWNAVRERLCGESPPLRLTHNFRSAPAVVGLVNRVCERAWAEYEPAVAQEIPGSRVDYQPLVAARRPTAAAGLEWLAADHGGPVAERRLADARMVASRVRQLIRDAEVEGDDGQLRPCRATDIAVLARKRVTLSELEPSLSELGIRYYNTATSGLADRLEVQDLVTALHVIDNPRNELKAFAFLRSPFVGLRDEVLARIRLDPGAAPGNYLEQAQLFSEKLAEKDSAAMFPAPESPLVAEVEREALARGLDSILRAHDLVDRAPADELLESVLEETGFRLHLLLRSGSVEALANIERFLALLAEYRHLPLGSFLALWDQWGEQDMGIPQAPLFSQGDDVMTLSTIHASKGLEWPVVILMGTGDGLLSNPNNAYWSDPDFGPVLLPNKDDQGLRSEKMARRMDLESESEEIRLLYVALTRARDRLVIAGPTEKLAGYSKWLSVGLDEAVEESEAVQVRRSDEPKSGESGESWARQNDPADPGLAVEGHHGTGTGRQIDAFGPRSDPSGTAGQFDMFASPPPGPPAEPNLAPVPDAATMVVYRKPEPVQGTLADAPVSLDWMAGIREADWPAIVSPIRVPVRSFSTSATEMRLRETKTDEWEKRYLHGVEPEWSFAPKQGSGGKLSPLLRGTVIHGVLERIEEASELQEILNETIGGIDAPELETVLATGSTYRTQLEAEIVRVVKGADWKWYVEGENYRELPFVHLVGKREWRQGAFDLYRPPRPGPPESRSRDEVVWIIDFKTHEIDSDQVAGVALEYEIQARVYREAASQLGSPKVRVALHFTHPNVSTEV